MTTITFDIQVNWAFVFFKDISEMVQKKSSTCFVVQISKLIMDAGFNFTTKQDGTTTTMIDSENVTASNSSILFTNFLKSRRRRGPTRGNTKIE